MNLTNTEPWTKLAACAHPHVNADDFHPNTGRRDIAARALAVCAECEVTTQCLEYALRTFTEAGDDGIWGSTTPKQRRGIRAARRRARRGEVA